MKNRKVLVTGGAGFIGSGIFGKEIIMNMKVLLFLV